MTNYIVSGIDWDTSDDDEAAMQADDESLPKKVLILGVENEDDIADILSDNFGFCVNTYDAEETTDSTADFPVIEA